MIRAHRAAPALLATLVAILATAAAGQAEEKQFVLDAAASKVTFLLEATGHDVEGTLAVQSGRFSFDGATGAATGTVVLDLKSARTGSDGRDKDMHQDVLETGKFPLATLRIEKVKGAVAATGASQVALEGVLQFHGADHKVSLPTKVDVQNGRAKADATLTIPYVAWGLHDPSILILRVGKTVAVKIHAEGSLTPAEGAAAAKE